ncbi:aminotransferase class V-fold PLP-dependent enzyme [Seleniivibrio sp.]|uniref:aminotransferase class V-fold PLP-dependent enzyme n=1 Tax=Seleniivibrio sp. TaxID=2898801 RepID=UPI0025FFD5AC|nr:aminotransferase class V-fold PLP-dependent enzyme [Seleniivibrio sp.]MCD8553485.1 aminotransferase class V-fold PLP-dependent enzyme [Seleniivibrio sp.]
MSKDNNVSFRHLVVGCGNDVNSINFDNAATTPPLVSVMDAVRDFACCYSSVHRGSGRRADHCSGVYEQTRADVLRFMGADENTHTALFTKNTTESLNLLANTIPTNKKTVIVTEMEHHSNDLPWRRRFNVVHAMTDRAGRLDLNSLEYLLKKHRGDTAMVSVTGASNVTGFTNPLREISAIVHDYDAELCVDAAQLAPHKVIDMTADDIDYLAFSAHKLYAPFGTGVLVGRTGTFETAFPFMAGGGTVDIVTKNSVLWGVSPAKFEAGTPNLMGVVALGAAMKTLSSEGLASIYAHESALTDYALDRLERIDGVRLYSDRKGIGVISFNYKDIFHADLATALSATAGIDVRSGCFCAQPYVQKLLNISLSDIALNLTDGNLRRPGMVRISFGMYNGFEEVDRFCDALISIRGVSRSE